VGGQTYNIGGGGQIALNEGIALIEEMSGRRLDVAHAGTEAGDVRATCADTSRASGDLDFVATVPFEEGLRRQFDWYVQDSQRAASLAAE
jgi:nucleoside-diphosphate-sugar epimerase